MPKKEGFKNLVLEKMHSFGFFFEEVTTQVHYFFESSSYQPRVQFLNRSGFSTVSVTNVVPSYLSTLPSIENRFENVAVTTP